MIEIYDEELSECRQWKSERDTIDVKVQSHASGSLLPEQRLPLIGPVLIEVTKGSANESTVGDILYQCVKADRAADDIPRPAKSKSKKTLLPKRRGG